MRFTRIGTCAHALLDLKPENVLICIDDVESIIQAELAASASATTPPTRLVGVPPSRGRGGNQTPRSESVFITGSQPLPSPSSSYGQSPMLDKWAFGMSKIDSNDASKPGSLKATSAAESSEEGRRALSEEMNQTSERISQLQFDMNGQPQPQPQRSAAGPSLLTQQAPDHPTLSSSPKDLSPEKFPIINDGPSLTATAATTPDIPVMDGTERITVKIADLGNGM